MWRRRRILFQLLQRDCHRALQLRIVPRVHSFWIKLHFHIRCDAVILDIPLAAGIEESEIGRGNRAAIHQRRILRDANQSTPGAFAHQRSHVRVAEHPGHHVATGTRHFIGDHHLGAEDRSRRRSIDRAVTWTPPSFQRTVQHINHIIGRLSTRIETLVHNHALFVHLGEVISIEAGESALSGIRHVDIRQLAAAQLVHLAAIFFHPRLITQLLFARDWHHRYLARIGSRWIRTHAQNYAFVRSAFQQTRHVVTAF